MSNAVLESSPPASVETPTAKVRLWMPSLLFAVLWADLIRLLSNQWATREQYAYGYFVPVFAAFLLWLRWMHRPTPVVEPNRTWLSGAVALAVLFLLPLRVVYEINPDWPLLSWVYTSNVVAITLYVAWRAGGRSWALHFAFPVALILVAVVWPWKIEKGLTQGLMKVVSGLTVEILGWIDIPAMQRGNLIELETGTLGVDEACSGIRSLQSSLLTALLLGELYRMKAGWRLGLIAVNLVLAFFFNVVRTLILSWQASLHGPEVLNKWHDPAGFSITVACFLVLWGFATLLQRWASPPAARAPASSGRMSLTALLATRRYLLAVGVWSILTLLATEAWYRAHEIKQEGAFRWSANFPTNAPTYSPIEINDKVTKNLRHDVGQCGKWTLDDTTVWAGYYFRWNPKSIASIISARQHRPDVCLTASGLRQLEDAGTELFSVQGLQLPFRKYTFGSTGGPLHVFFCQWEDGAERQTGMWWSKKAERLRAAWVGRRRLGQQSLEFVISGHPSLEAAAEALRQRLPSLVRIAPPGA